MIITKWLITKAPSIDSKVFHKTIKSKIEKHGEKERKRKTLTHTNVDNTVLRSLINITYLHLIIIKSMMSLGQIQIIKFSSFTHNKTKLKCVKLLEYNRWIHFTSIVYSSFSFIRTHTLFKFAIFGSDWKIFLCCASFFSPFQIL